MSLFRRTACRKLLFLCCFFPAASFLYAQNGISIDKVKEDPYFVTGSAFNPENEEGNSTGAQMDNPDDPDTFYNAENWSGGIKKFDKDEVPPKVQEEISDTETPLKTDGQAGLPGAFDPSGTRFNVSLGWHCQYSPVFLKSGFASYFDNFFGFEFIGAQARIDWLFAGKKKVKAGFAAYGEWTWLYQKNENTEITAHQYSADILFVTKVITEFGNQLDFHIGGGFLGIEKLQFTSRKNELVRGPVSWRYPEARAGFGYELFLYDHFGFRCGLDFAWPFLFENYYPRLGCTAGLEARF